MFEGFDEGRFRHDGADLFYRTGGPADGAAILLLHGYPQTHHIWAKVAPALAAGARLVIPDLRGYGASGGPAADAGVAAYAKRAMAADMAALMSHLGHDRFMVAGHDRGGRVGFRLCLDHGDRVDRFAAIDIIPTLDAWDALDADRALSSYHWQFLALPAPVPERMIGADPGFYLEHLLTRWAGDRTALDPRAVAEYAAAFARPSVIEATCQDYRAGAGIDREHDAADRTAGRRLACPVLALWGTGYLAKKTATSPLDVWRRWADDVTEVPLPCGHFVVEEKPDEAAHALTRFFGI